MADFTPSPHTWTLRLKAHKTTVVVHVDPLHTFTSIKAQLYNALRETSLHHAETGEVVPLPDSPDDIQFGCAVNINDPSAGFVLGDWEYAADEEGEAAKTTAKGKGKGKARADDSAVVLPDSIGQCPKGAGLKDGAVLAFRWRGDGTDWENGSLDVDEDDYVDVGVAGTQPSMWGVRIPSFEDSYGAENVGDVGGGQEYDE